MPRFRMDRLKADKQYRITELNRKRCPSAPLDNKMFSGRILMKQGVELPLQHEYASRILEPPEVS
ncbi:GH36 C-terminal domain-containing protein [Phocaeicola vulgatus]|nr:GH36 C-terminal domain-containing protein [Phocaeicola vulgatus]